MAATTNIFQVPNQGLDNGSQSFDFNQNPFGGGAGSYDQNYGFGGYNYNLNWFDDTNTLSGANPFDVPPQGILSPSGVLAADVNMANQPGASGAGANSIDYGTPENAIANATTGNVAAQPTGSETVIDPNPSGYVIGAPNGVTAATGGIFGAGGGQVIPIPGIGPLGAIAATIALSDGNLGGGGGMPTPTQALDNVTKTVTDPGTAINNVGNSVMGPQPAGQSSGIFGVPVSWPSGGSGATPPTTTNTDTSSATTVVTPTSMGGSTTTYPNGNSVTNNPPDQSGSAGVVPVTPPSTVPQFPPSTTSNGNINNSPSQIVTPGSVGGNPDNKGGGVVVNTGGAGETPTAPAIVPTPTPTTPGVTASPVAPIVPIVLPTTKSMALPTISTTSTNYYGTNNTGLSTLTGISPDIQKLYQNFSSSLSGTDLSNFNAMMGGILGANSQLTGGANQQTALSNTALRQGNSSDVANLGGTALQQYQQANQPLYQSLAGLQGSANQLQSQANSLSASAGSLSPQEQAQAQQAARSAWQARGLVNSNGAVGDEILNQDALIRARQQQAFGNQATATQGMGVASNAQQANAFNPFAAVLGAQYGNQTSNVGLNTNLYNQAGQLSSGQLSNQMSNSIVNPNSAATMNVGDYNANAQNAASIANQNNAAAMQGANTLANQSLVNSLLGGYSQNPSYWNSLIGGTPASGTQGQTGYKAGTPGLVGNIGNLITGIFGGG